MRKQDPEVGEQAQWELQQVPGERTSVSFPSQCNQHKLMPTLLKHLPAVVIARCQDHALPWSRLWTITAVFTGTDTYTISSLGRGDSTEVVLTAEPLEKGARHREVNLWYTNSLHDTEVTKHHHKPVFQ